MIKKYQKSVCFGIILMLFLFVGFFNLSLHKASAAGLEVQYPVISGENLNTDANLTLPSYVKYLFNAGMFIGFFAVFISLIIAGVMYFLSPVNAGLLSGAKDRISGAISGLLILMLTYLIITTINPQLNVFQLNTLPPTPPIPAAPLSSGVSFLKNICPDKGVQPNVSSISDLGALANQVGVVGIQPDITNIIYYISILYHQTNFWGQCQYLDPNQACQLAQIPASSASIHRYDFNPADNNFPDGGVYFYRKSCLSAPPGNNAEDLINQCNKNGGGYFKLSISDIGSIYQKDLGSLQFTGVPGPEQDCIKYDANGNCTNKVSPSLGGGNISSIIINGNYLVLLIYKGASDNPSGPWTSCQEFPAPGDVNSIGPQQLKWQNIMNSGHVIPNYVLIIPIQK